MASSLTVDELRAQLEQLGLSTRGLKPELKKRLRRGTARATSPPGNEAEAEADELATGQVGEQMDASASSKQNEKKKEKPFKPRWTKFLVLDVEATCEAGKGGRSGFDFPNEIIEWPVVLLQWARDERGNFRHELETVDEFRSCVRPSWRPRLTRFCNSLTGIDQASIDSAPTWTEMLSTFVSTFLSSHDLLQQDPSSAHTSSYARAQLRPGVAWVTHGPFDLRDFVTKQCFISGVRTPYFLRGPLLDVRRLVPSHLSRHPIVPPSSTDIANRSSASPPPKETRIAMTANGTRAPVRDLSITGLLSALSLSAFEGRQHAGLDDARNIARLLCELARRKAVLEPNVRLDRANEGKRWAWMGQSRGVVLWEGKEERETDEEGVEQIEDAKALLLMTVMDVEEQDGSEEGESVHKNPDQPT